jgi:dipeptidyl aminopeptidase/acylaminoacyl peptidase
VPQTEDLVDGVKYLIAEGGIDPEKVGIHGWSFGGFQTQMCLYTAPETFKLGIAGAGPTEWQNYNNWYSGGVIGDTRVGKPEDLDKYSLTKLAKNLQGHLMLLHGMEDTNVLFQDTIKVYQELLKAGKGPLVELVVDPTGGHGLGGDIKTKDRFAIYEGYLRRMWGPYVAPSGG